jgi:hypothetical protein
MEVLYFLANEAPLGGTLAKTVILAAVHATVQGYVTAYFMRRN